MRGGMQCAQARRRRLPLRLQLQQALVLALVLLVLCGVGAHASRDSCQCMCCDSQTCINRPVSVETCTACSKELCASLFDVCQQNGAYVRTNCVDRGNVFYAVMAMVPIAVIVVLLILLPFRRMIAPLRRQLDEHAKTYADLTSRHAR
jgi:hypothetical protein